MLHCDVSLVVRIVAFQAVDPGSSPGRRTFFSGKGVKVTIYSVLLHNLYWLKKR